MGYDYSLTFLAKHRDLMQKLVQIAQSGELLVYEHAEWEKIRARYQLVRSVLANMSRNLKEYSDIRTKVRCWTASDENGFRLFIGLPDHKVTGRPPQEQPLPWSDRYVSASQAQAQATGLYRHEHVVEVAAGDWGNPTYLALIGKLAQQPTTVTMAEFKSDLEIENTEIQKWFSENQFGVIGWWVIGGRGTTFILKRL